MARVAIWIAIGVAMTVAWRAGVRQAQAYAFVKYELSDGVLADAGVEEVRERMLGCRQWRFETGALGEATFLVDTITRAIDGAPECRIAQLVLERRARLNPRPRLRVNETRHSRLCVSCAVGMSDFAH